MDEIIETSFEFVSLPFREQIGERGSEERSNVPPQQSL